MLTANKYLEYANRVIAWNKVANGGHDSVNIVSQKEYTKSELDETEAAVKANDVQEILDGVCDVFVTGSYLVYQLDNYRLAVDQLPKSAHLDFEYFNEIIKDEFLMHEDVAELCNWCIREYGEDVFHDYMLRVLASNDSKYVPDDQWDEDYEVKTASEKYAEKGFRNIVGVPGELNGLKVWILRADYGVGKILKPTTFKEPVDIIL